jgi:5-carboxymethyl-2-hydroxymuconate isomerase
MPHIRVEYDEKVAGVFDRRGFAQGVHSALAEIVGGRAGGCKTRFLPLAETFVADGSDAYAMVHVEIGILSGRTPEAKRELGEAVLGLLRKNVGATPGAELQLSVDVVDLDRETYVKYDRPAEEA